jgi:DNA topoisomerase IB
MTTASEKAADKMHADLDAMVSDAKRHAVMAADAKAFAYWQGTYKAIERARAAVLLCMSERDRKIAAG